MIFLAAPSPASEVAVVCGTATGSETLLAMLPAFDTLVGAFETTEAALEATSVGAFLEADVRPLTTLLSSR
jgi:hypothetical protein